MQRILIIILTCIANFPWQCIKRHGIIFNLASLKASTQHTVAQTADSKRAHQRGKLWGTKDRGILDQAGQCHDLSCPPMEAQRDHKWCLNAELHACASGYKDHPKLLLSFNYLGVFGRMGLRAKDPLIHLYLPKKKWLENLLFSKCQSRQRVGHNERNRTCSGT